MRFAIASSGDSPSSKVSEHFGHSPYFIVIESDGKSILSMEPHANPHLHGHEPLVVPRFVSTLKVEALICGGAGSRAVLEMEKDGIKVLMAPGSSVSEAASRFIRRELDGADNRCHH